MQEPLSSPAQACLYVARWAIPKGGATAAEFAPPPVVRQILEWMPKWFLLKLANFPHLLNVIAWILLPHLRAIEITDGNVNFSFAVTGRNGRSIFVKQARAFLKWVPSMALERERMEREVAYFEEIATVLEGDAKRFLPTIHDFDRESSVIIMDYLEDHRVLFEHLFEHGSIPYNAACGLADFTAIVAARTLAPRKPSNAAAAALAAGRAEKYWNPTLRAIQQEHVYSICFRESEIGRELASDDELMDEVRCLKAKYLGYSFDEFDRWSVCHGDLHPGGVMLGVGGVKVIDPEFTCFGPPGLDLGSLFSGFVLAYLYHQLGLGAKPPSRDGEPDPDLLEALRLMWDRYENVLLEEGLDVAQVTRIGEDACGYAMMEVLRTSLGFAGARDPQRRIPNADALKRYQALAVALVCHVLKRRRSGGPSMMFEQLEMQGQAAEGWRTARAAELQRGTVPGKARKDKIS